MKRILAELDKIQSAYDKGEVFERLVKCILEEAPEFKSQYKKVWRWDDYPDNRGRDLGIDLVAEKKDGKRIAIQAKGWAENESLPWGELATFYGDAMGRIKDNEIHGMMLMATAGSLTRNAEKKLDEAGCAKWLRRDIKGLGLSPQLSIEDVLEGSIKPFKKFKPRRHQKKAIKQTLAHIKKHKRGQVIMACGTGKTLAALWVKEALSCKRTIVFVPSIALLRQTWANWSKHANEDFYSIAVCSDESATSQVSDLWANKASEAGLPSRIEAFFIVSPVFFVGS